MWIVSNLRPGEVWSRRVAGGFGVLRQKKRHSSGDHHPRRHHTDAAVHRRVRLLLQVGRRRPEPAQNHSPRVEESCVLFFLRRKSQQAEREYEKVKHQLENLEESVRDRCKKEFTGECPRMLTLGPN